MAQLIARHKMASDDGRVFVVEEYQEYIDAGSKDDPHATIPGMKYLLLEDGSRVNHIDDDTFKIVQSGTVLRRA